MWNILFVGFVLYVSISNGDVSHLGSSHPGYPIHKPDHPLELPGEGTTETVAGYPKVIPNNPLQIPDASTGNVRNQFPDTQFQGTSTGGVSIQQQQNHPSHHDNHDHHYHGQDGKYNHHDDGRGWDIRKSVPGEPGQDYPTYDSVPSTSFTCKEKVPGYYADEDTRCQVFRICTTNSLKTHNSFLCPNGSLFSQEFLTCDWWMNVDCASSSNFHYKNKDIGKMPTGSQLMYQVSKMLEAPNNNPYFFTKQQEQQVRDQTIADNQIQGTGSVHDVYLPVKQPVVTTTKKYYTPTVPATTTTTSTTTPKPTISISNLHKIKTSEEKLNINQQSLQNVVNREQEENIRQQSLQNVQKQYIPPPVPTIEQSRLSNVKTEQNKIKIDQSTASGFKGYDYQKQVPSLTTDQQVTNQQNPSLTVTKEQSHTVTHSEKTTHVFQNTEEGPQKISLLDNAQNTAQHLPSGNVAQIDRKEQQISSGVNQFTSSGVQQQGGLQQQIGGSQFTASRNQQEGGLQKQTGVQQQQIGDNQFTLSGVQQQSGVKHFTTSAVQQQGGLQQQTGGSQLDFSGIKQQAGVLQQGEVPQQTGGNQFDFSGINQFTTSGNTQQQQGGIVQQQQLQKVAPGSNLDITKDQAFQQIDNIQSGIQQLSQEQDNIQKFGVGILNPRDGPTIPAPNFGKNIQHSQFNSFQNIPQEFTYQGVQPNYFEEQSYNQNQGYQFQQPNYHEVTGQNFNYHGANRGDNFNFEVQKGGSAQNYNGERLSQHSNGHSHSAYSGHNVEYKESTKVDIVPSLGFHLNDDFEKDRFISAVLGGLIQDGPHYHSSTSANIDQQQFSPSDARFSSYQGPSSYLVPQASVQRLPSDSGYYR